MRRWAHRTTWRRSCCWARATARRWTGGAWARSCSSSSPACRPSTPTGPRRAPRAAAPAAWPPRRRARPSGVRGGRCCARRAPTRRGTGERGARSAHCGRGARAQSSTGRSEAGCAASAAGGRSTARAALKPAAASVLGHLGKESEAIAKPCRHCRAGHLRQHPGPAHRVAGRRGRPVGRRPRPGRSPAAARPGAAPGGARRRRGAPRPRAPPPPGGAGCCLRALHGRRQACACICIARVEENRQCHAELCCDQVQGIHGRRLAAPLIRRVPRRTCTGSRVLHAPYPFEKRLTAAAGGVAPGLAHRP